MSAGTSRQGAGGQIGGGPSAGDQPASRQPRGGVRFVLLHGGGCPGGAFHYRIDEQGACRAELAEAERGQHQRSIGIALDGDFDVAVPSAAQIAALKALLLQLKLRYPAWELGAHRQVRGGPETTCPGRRFPMKALVAWSRSELLRQRDDFHRRSIEEQYSRI